MSRLRRLARLALVPLLLSACAAEQAAAPPEAAGPVPVGLRLTLAGQTAPALGEDGAPRLELSREGADETLAFPFESGALAVHDLAPGRYEVTGLGALACRGLAFEVGARPRYLGEVTAKVVEAKYDVALISRARVPAGDVAALADAAGASPEAVDATPLAVGETAPCFRGRHGEMTTWEDLTLAEKIMLGAGMVGLCALALAGGGFCSFGG